MKLIASGIDAQKRELVVELHRLHSKIQSAIHKAMTKANRMRREEARLFDGG